MLSGILKKRNMYRKYLIQRKIWEFITLVPSLYVQTVQVQKQTKKQTTKPKTIRNTFILKI